MRLCPGWLASANRKVGKPAPTSIPSVQVGGPGPSRVPCVRGGWMEGWVGGWMRGPGPKQRTVCICVRVRVLVRVGGWVLGSRAPSCVACE